MYAAVLQCFHHNQGMVKAGLTFVKAINSDEAYHKVMKEFLISYPTKDGYTLHNVYVRQVPEKEDF
jgi:hypothetical protein